MLRPVRTLYFDLYGPAALKTDEAGHSILRGTYESRCSATDRGPGLGAGTV